MKYLRALVVLLTPLLLLAGCGDGPANEAPAPIDPGDHALLGFKVGILTGTVSREGMRHDDTLAQDGFFSVDNFIRGNCNRDADGQVDIADAVFMLGMLFLGEEAPRCQDACDVTDGGILTLADPIYLLLYLFRSGVAPGAPFPDCGPDLTPDELGSCHHEACEAGGGG